MSKRKNKFSICGLTCADCPSFIAHNSNDEELRIKTSREWAIEYNSPNLKPEDINCTGCLSLDGPLFNHCKVCKIRKCGMEKGVQNCGECVEYPGCQTIMEFHKMVPGAKKVCEKFTKK